MDTNITNVIKNSVGNITLSMYFYSIRHRYGRYILRRIHLTGTISHVGFLLRHTRYNNKHKIYHRTCIVDI